MGLRVWACSVCARNGKEFVVGRGLEGFNGLAKHFREEHFGQPLQYRSTDVVWSNQDESQDVR